MKKGVRFSAAIHKIGINPVIDPPENVLEAIFAQAGHSKGPIPVCGNLNGADFLQTLVKYRGSWRLYVNGEMLKASGLKVGDIADVAIAFDTRPRSVPMPKKLSAALRKETSARKAFGELSPSRQKEIFRYINSLKTEESIARSVEKIIRELKGDTRVKPLTVIRRKTKAEG